MTDNPAYDRAAALLNTVTQAFIAADLSVPERAYVSAEFETVDDIVDADGTDCTGEQLIVQVTRVFTGLPGSTPGFAPNDCVSPQTGEFIIRYTKCVPVLDNDGSPPEPEDIDFASEDTLKRMWLTGRAILKSVEDQDCAKLVLIDSVPVGTGGAGGFATTVHGSLP